MLKKNWIDSVKALTIYLVVCYHTTGSSFTFDLMQAWRMPLFFFVSGALFNRAKYESLNVFLIQRSFKKLIVPYLFFTVVTGLFWLILFVLTGQSGSLSLQEQIVGIGMGVGSGEHPHFNVPLWFITCLCVVEILYFVIDRYFKPALKPMILIASSVASYCLVKMGGHMLVWNLDIAPMCCLFYYLGHQLCYKKTFSFQGPRFVLLGALSLGLSAWIKLGNGVVDINSRFVGEYFHFYGAALLGILGVVLIAHNLPETKLAVFIGRNTSIFLAFHIITNGIIELFCKWGLGVNVLDTADRLIIGALSMAVISPIVFLLNKKCPAYIGKADFQIRIPVPKTMAKWIPF